MSSNVAGRDVNYIANAQANTIVFQTGDHSHPGAASGSHSLCKDVFRPSFEAPPNPREVELDFGDPFNRAGPQTQEAKVLHELLREDYDQRATRVITVHGKGGVGKSCILRGLARNEKVKERFPDGVYFLSLGMDANIGTLIQGLIEISRLSGGRKLGMELHNELSLRIVMQKVGEWLNGKTCLLLADDFWEENWVGADVVTELAEMLSVQSTLVMTTRFSAVATRGTEVEIKPLETTSDEAKDMLLRYSKLDWKEAGHEKGPAFDKLLRMCGGLPIFLAIVGKAVAKIALRFKHVRERTSAWEECVCMLEDSEMLEMSVYGYKGLGRTLHMSLKLLSEECGELFKGLSPYSLSEMHRAFCVFKKQAAIPMSVCRRLWRVKSDRAALKIGMGFADFGLADIEIEKRGGRQVKVVRLHDLVQIFAVKCAMDEGDVPRWHGRLLEGYISKAGDRNLVRRWWEVDEKSGEEYLFENLCRHLASSGNIEELTGLLLCGEWTKLRHKHGGLSAWKQEFSEYVGRKTVASLTEDEEIESGLRMVRDAVVESWAAVHGNLHELGFQIVGRLVDSENKFVRKYLESVEKVQSGPWLKPMQRLWTRPGEGGMAAEFHLEGVIWDIAVQKDPFIAVVAAGKKVTVLDLKEMTVMSRCIGHTGFVRKVGISADGKRVFSWSDDCTVRQWVIHSGEEDTDKCIRLEDYESDEDDHVMCAAFSSCRSFAVTGSKDGMVKVWNLNSGERIGRIMNATESVSCIEVSPNGRIIATGLEGGALQLWDMQTFSLLGGELEAHLHEVSNTAFTSDGRFVATTGGPGGCKIRLWDVEDKTRIRGPLLFEFYKHEACSITFSEDDKQIISAHLDGSIIIWDVARRAAIRNWDAHSAWIMRCVAIVGDGNSQWAVSGGEDHIVRVWDLEAAANVRDERIQHDEGVECIAASRDGRFFVSASEDKTLHIWNAADGTALGEALYGHEDAVTCVVVSPDSRRLVSGSRDCTVRVWEVGDGAQDGAALLGHWGPVNCVAYSEDGRFVVSGSEDCTARLWKVIDNPDDDESTGELASMHVREAEREVREMSSSRESRLEMTLVHVLSDEERDPGHEVASVSMSRDGLRVLCGLDNGEIWVWDTSSRKCIYCSQSLNEGEIKQIEVPRENEVVTMNKWCEELRWRLHDDGGLSLMLENEDETKVARAELQEGSVSRALSPLLCLGRTVHLSDKSKKIATLPDEVGPSAWKYDAERRVLCIGLKDGRVFLFRVE